MQEIFESIQIGDYGNFLTLLWESITFEMVLKFLVVYFFMIWIALLVWVIRDIHNRTSNIFLQIFSIAIVLFLTPLGIFLYLLIRPGKTLFEKYYKEIEENLDTFHSMIEDETKSWGSKIECFGCSKIISPNFQYCPDCKTNLRGECSGCKKSIFLGWEYCPYCAVKNKNYQKKKTLKKQKK